MKVFRMVIIALFPMMFILISCSSNQIDLEQTNSSEETRVMIEFNTIDFKELDEFFQNFFTGFNSDYFYNFHYADVTTRHIVLPAPTDPRIKGFFNIMEEAWGDYIRDDDSWRDIMGEWSEIGTVPDVFNVNTEQLNWMISNNFIDRHRGERIGGAFLICKKHRLVWFHLWRN